MQTNSDFEGHKRMDSRSTEDSERFSLEDRIELLVEGELDSAGRKLLFAELDKSPELWKDLALMYAEHQPLRAAVIEACHSPGPTSSPTRRDNRRVSDWYMALSIAAAMLLAFGLGQLSVLPNEIELVDVITPRDVVEDEQIPEQSVPNSPLEETNVAPEAQLLAIEENGKANQIVGYATWVGNYGLQSSPVFLGKSFEASWSQSNPPKLHPVVEQKFAKAGVRARPERKFVSLELKDGPKLTIPIDDWKLLRVGREMF